MKQSIEENVMRKLKKEFDADTDELLNKICDTFHDELKEIADKYGSIEVLIKMK